MVSRVRALVFFAVALVVFPEVMKAPVVFRPTDKTKFVAPGEEEPSGTAKQLFQNAQTAENRGNLSRAISTYKALVRRHPKDALAPGALYRAAELQEKLHKYIPAAESYRTLVEKYPTSPRFNEAIEAQFRIGEMYLGGKKVKIFGVGLGSPLERAIEIFAAVVRTAPYGKYTARAQFGIGLAREKQSANEAALQAYQAVADKFPNEPVAADAQYQIGYIWLMAARRGTRDIAATNNAKIAFQDFLYRYPNSEKAAQARANLRLLEGKQIAGAFDVAKFYDKQKNYRAAVIYYNEVIRQQPGSKQSDQAKKRINDLRAKFGHAALDPQFVKEEDAAKKKPQFTEQAPAARAEGEATGEQRSAASEPAPISSEPPPAAPPPPPAATSTSSFSSLPPATDLALPPPSLNPPRDHASESSSPSVPDSSPTPEATATPESGSLMP